MTTDRPATGTADGDGRVTGIVFDIQRASLHDGPGLRTTVFLKGCPLHCEWCHNPESRSPRPQLSFDPARCTFCGACVSACGNHVHDVAAPTPSSAGRHDVQFNHCLASGECVAACPASALRIVGRSMSVDEVLGIVLRDVAFYSRSGGGLTISGGEPTAQLAFTSALLRSARAHGIHTCVETCGFAPAAACDALAPLTDLFLFDWKASDPATHDALTGVRNERILANLRRLHEHGSRILLRCPLIPGVNDDDAHLQATAALLRTLPSLTGVEILPYHDAGLFKYDRFGIPRPAHTPHPPSPALEREWHRKLLPDTATRSGPEAESVSL